MSVVQQHDQLNDSDTGDDYLETAAKRLAQQGRPLVYSVSETAQLLGISRALAYSLVRQRELPAIHLGRRLVVPRRALERYLDERAAV